MPIFLKNDKVVFFIHIPKSAGSAVERIARDLGWAEEFSIRKKSLNDIKYCKSSFQHLHAEVLDLIFKFEEMDSVFTIVRDPFSRLKSEYYWQARQGITNLNVKDWICDTFDKYESNNYVYDNHIRPQVEFLPSGSNIKVFKLEEGGVLKAKNELLRVDPYYNRYLEIFRNIWFKIVNSENDKVSTKEQKIEDEFMSYKDIIFKFYKNDYLAFSYDI